jgi:hypothetical protein
VCKEYSLPVNRTTQNYSTCLQQTMYGGSVKSPGSTAHKKLGMRCQCAIPRKQQTFTKSDCSAQGDQSGTASNLCSGCARFVSRSVLSSRGLSRPSSVLPAKCQDDTLHSAKNTNFSSSLLQRFSNSRAPSPKLSQILDTLGTTDEPAGVREPLLYKQYFSQKLS